MESKDDKILRHKFEIEKMELQLKGCKWKPVTNCKVELFGKHHNLNVCNDEGLLVRMSMYYNELQQYANQIDMPNVVHDGFTASEWLYDIDMRIEFVSKKQKSEKLKLMKIKLEALLSEDKKAEMELNSLLEYFKSIKG